LARESFTCHSHDVDGPFPAQGYTMGPIIIVWTELASPEQIPQGIELAEEGIDPSGATLAR